MWFNYGTYGASTCHLYRTGTLVSTTSEKELKEHLRLLPQAFGKKVKGEKGATDKEGVHDLFTQYC